MFPPRYSRRLRRRLRRSLRLSLRSPLPTSPPCLARVNGGTLDARSNAFLGLSHADRLGLVFLALYDGGLATTAAAGGAAGAAGTSPLSPLPRPSTPPPNGAASRQSSSGSLRGVEEGGFKGNAVASLESDNRVRCSRLFGMMVAFVYDSIWSHKFSIWFGGLLFLWV